MFKQAKFERNKSGTIMLFLDRREGDGDKFFFFFPILPSQNLGFVTLSYLLHRRRLRTWPEGHRVQPLHIERPHFPFYQLFQFVYHFSKVPTKKAFWSSMLLRVIHIVPKFCPRQHPLLQYASSYRGME